MTTLAATSSNRTVPVDDAVEDDQVRWPAERFYWAVLDQPAWRRSGPLPVGLLPVLAEEVPVDVDDLHAVCAPLGNGRLLVCAARRSDLSTLDPAVRTLSPREIPSGVDVAADPRALDLLVGEFESPVLRRARQRGHLASVSVLAFATALAAVGLLRRTAHWTAVAEAAEAAAHTVASGAVPGADPARLGAELARLRGASEAARKVRPPADAAAALADLLTAWPTSVPTEPQSLVVSGAGATVSVAVRGDPADFLRAMRPPPGWRLDEPRLSASGSITRVTLSLRPLEIGP